MVIKRVSGCVTYVVKEKGGKRRKKGLYEFVGVWVKSETGSLNQDNILFKVRLVIVVLKGMSAEFKSRKEIYPKRGN